MSSDTATFLRRFYGMGPRSPSIIQPAEMLVHSFIARAPPFALGPLLQRLGRDSYRAECFHNLEAALLATFDQKSPSWVDFVHCYYSVVAMVTGILP